MASWLIGVGIAGFFVSLALGLAMRPKGFAVRSGPSTGLRWWVGTLAAALAGAVLAVLFAWPAWHLGAYLGPYFDLSETLGGATFACIFGLGGAAVTGAFYVARRERDDER